MRSIDAPRSSPADSKILERSTALSNRDGQRLPGHLLEVRGLVEGARIDVSERGDQVVAGGQVLDAERAVSSELRELNAPGSRDPERPIRRKHHDDELGRRPAGRV